MAAIGIILQFIGAAVGIVVGVLGGLVGAAVGLMGAALGLLIPIFPVVLFILGIVWLVKGSNPKHAAGVRALSGNATPPRSAKSTR